jgi:hypothetical protein
MHSKTVLVFYSLSISRCDLLFTGILCFHFIVDFFIDFFENQYHIRFSIILLTFESW